jgi:hypothetical protein
MHSTKFKLIQKIVAGTLGGMCLSASTAPRISARERISKLVIILTIEKVPGIPKLDTGKILF